MLSMHAEMVREGTSSMAIDVEAWVTRQPDGERMKVTEAKFIFVAIDETGAKRPLPPEAGVICSHFFNCEQILK